MELPRDLSKLKPKFRKPLIIEFILDELYENEHRPIKGPPALHVEPDVTLEKGRRFAFVFSVRHYAMFLFVECAKNDVDLEWYTNRPHIFEDFILMDIYAIDYGEVTGRVKCISLECCVNLWSVISLAPLAYTPNMYKFQERLTSSDGTKGHIDRVWHNTKMEFANLSLIEAAKFSFGSRIDKYASNHPSVLRALANPEVMREVHALKSQVYAAVTSGGSTGTINVPGSFVTAYDNATEQYAIERYNNANITVDANRAPDPSEPVEPYYGPRKDPNRFGK
jgi:hypothetical protein